MPNFNTLIDCLDAAPGNRTAIVLPELALRITYSNLKDQVMTMAESLLAKGISHGDRVASVLPNGLPAIVSFFAASIAGTAAPLNPGYLRDELSFYLEDTSARAVLCPPDGSAEVQKAAEGKVPIYTVDMDSSGFVRITDASGRLDAAAPLPDAIALILHTSGSTGRPKRVPLRHRNIAASAINIVNHYALTPDDVTLCVMPLFHIHGLVASVVSTLLAGGAVVVPAKFNPRSFWQTVRDYRVSWYSAVPTMHHLLLSRVGDGRVADSAGLRFIRSCSAALPPAMMSKLEQAFGAPVLEAYGMTEASHQMTSNPQPPMARKPGSVGLATGVRVSIIDEQANHLSTGSRGEIVIQGPSVIDGYENNPEANAASFTNGWFRTGDQGFLDSDGYLTLTGRIKELINRGGEKIAPREIDEMLQTHPAVLEAVAFGVPDPVWGEQPEAAVVLSEQVSETELLSYSQDRLAHFKCPQRIHILKTIPRTPTGKIQRGVVAQSVAAERRGNRIES
jgi:acyl-CoA synthetase (AMP-forming)/AMP-acid ligase II